MGVRKDASFWATHALLMQHSISPATWPPIFTPILIFNEAILNKNPALLLSGKKIASILRLSTWLSELFKRAGSEAHPCSRRLLRPKLLHHAQVKVCIHYSVKPAKNQTSPLVFVPAQENKNNACS